jgi:glycosyltransferase involved in cell wall biosynthesis
MKQLVVLIPVYRNQPGLDRSLQSLCEAEGSFDVVIVDDGSTQPISAPLRLRADISVVLLRCERNGGIAVALNHGLRHILAQGYRFVARLDAGDTVVRERFERQVQFLTVHANCAVVSSDVKFVDAKGAVLFHFRAPCRPQEIADQMHVNTCVMHPASMLRTSALGEAGLYREDVPCAEDYELFLRLSRSYQLANLPEALTHCEYSRQGISIKRRRRLQQQRLKLQLLYFNPASFYSFYGVVRTLVALLVPQAMVLRFKRAYLH